jgi:hypothetical protein
VKPLARGALKKLGQFQAQAMDDYRDAEPGKIAAFRARHDLLTIAGG